jgi:endonuclease/exonuclease/phosphatase family metal-dependent hydrolase
MNSSAYRIFVLFLLCLWSLVSIQAEEPATAVRVMTFNIRYGTAKDGENHWDRRKDFLIDTIKAFDPDLLGTQETLGFQRDYLAKQMPDYDVLGVGRDDGGESGEMMALYYKRERFEKLDGGHFWLSETPDKTGSKSWDSSLPRMVTWVKLSDKKNKTAAPFLFFNTHFDHLGSEARLESARLLRRQLEKIGQGQSLVVTGDFNAGELSSPYKALFDTVDDQKSPVVDAYRLVHTQREPGEGTFSRFLPTPSDGLRIDWIGVSRDWHVLEIGIDRTSRDGRTASDHFAVKAVIQRSGS